jgi:gamma-butyrobetaine dioxygenase
MAEQPRFRVRFRFRPGDLLSFDNERVLHGRSSFDPATGVRHLQGCYMEADELLCRQRILSRRKAQSGADASNGSTRAHE